MKFNDLDADGVKDIGEPGLPNWRIFVDYNGNGTWDLGGARPTSRMRMATTSITGIVAWHVQRPRSPAGRVGLQLPESGH